MLVRHGAHDRADGQTVEVIVNKDQDTEQECRKARACAGFDMCSRPFTVGAGAAGLVHHHDDDAEDDKEDQNADIVGVRQIGDQSFADDRVEYAGEAALCGDGIQDTARHNADEQRGIDLLRDERQSDRDDRREQRPQRSDRAAHGRLDRAADREDHNDRCKDDLAEIFVRFHDACSPFLDF